jgi:hypothetical protein
MKFFDTTNINKIKLFTETNFSSGILNVTDPNKQSATIQFFEDLYGYPPKFKVTWDGLDELKEDPFYSSNYNNHENGPANIKNLNELSTISSLEEKNYNSSNYIAGYNGQKRTSQFYRTLENQKFRNSLKNVPIYVVLNGDSELVLAKPTNSFDVTTPKHIFLQHIYKFCGAFDKQIPQVHSVGLFFMARQDAEMYLQEVGREDPTGTKTVGLAIHCVNLDYAYQLVHQFNADVDYRFVPNLDEIKTLLTKHIGKSNMIVEKDQQQLRVRRRPVNILPLGINFGKRISPFSSFLSKQEYFKGVPIYIVQVTNTESNILAEPYFTTLGFIDSTWSRFIRYFDFLVGFGQNWIMQGSIMNLNKMSNVENYIFFDYQTAVTFCQKNKTKLRRYNGSRTSTFFNLEAVVRQPKMFVYNLEDFLETWEETILTQNQTQALTKDNTETIFNAKDTYLIPSFTEGQIIKNETKIPNTNVGSKSYESVVLKYKKLSSFLKMFLSSY